MTLPELLAPAGSPECLIAAANAGADAVYMGGTKFGARAFAENPDTAGYLKGMDRLHIQNKKIYLTLNTLLRDDELEEVDGFLRPLYENGLDGVIVQDMGVVKYVSERFPRLPIHLSTQMTINTASAAETVRALAGDALVTRVVPSRELSLDEIRKFREETDLEIECFIHGALCYCYSGQCLMSSMFGGRSGNRGRCAQPCRLEYEIDGKKRHFLSPKDTCTAEILPDLIEAGISSFKIEGRMKGAGYVAGVTEGYRRILDKYGELGKNGYRDYVKRDHEFLPSIIEQMMELYNRGGFCHGFYDKGAGAEKMADLRANHNGVLVGTVEKVKGINAGIRLEKDVYPQDILEIRDGANTLYDFTLGDAGLAGSLIFSNFKSGSGVLPGNLVFRTRHTVLLEALEERYLKKDAKVLVKGRLKFVTGEPMEFTCTCRGVSVTATGNVVEAAKNSPMTDETLSEKLTKTGGTLYEFSKLSIENDGKGFAPVGQLNELRRTALEMLEEALLEKSRRRSEDDKQQADSDKEEQTAETPENGAVPASEIMDSTTEPSPLESDSATEPAPWKSDSTHESVQDSAEAGNLEHHGPRIQILVSTADQLSAAVKSSAEDIFIDITDIPVEKVNDLCDTVLDAGKKVYLALPRILNRDGVEKLTKFAGMLRNPAVSGYMLRNLDPYLFIADIATKDCREIYFDYSLYVFNNSAKDFYGFGCSRMTVPLELSGTQMERLGIHDMVLPVYGRMPLMLTKNCQFRIAGRCLNDTENAKDRAPLIIKDRMQKEMPHLAHCGYCYASIHNSDTYCLSGHFDTVRKLDPFALRLDFTLESAKETENAIRAFENEWNDRQMPDKSFLYRKTSGAFLRGTE